MRDRSCAGSGSQRFVHVVDALLLQQMLHLAHVSVRCIQVCLAEETRPVPRVADARHPRGRRQRRGHVVPHRGVMGAQTRCHRDACRHAYGRVSHTIREVNAFPGDAVHMRRFHPVRDAAQRVPPLLVGHDDEDIRLGHSIFLLDLLEHIFRLVRKSGHAS